MAEIKSTLDIIMEKASRFSVTEEEKKGFKRQELEGKIKGLVQKTLDGTLGSEKLEVELLALQEEDLVKRILRDEVLARLEAEVNKEALLKMLDYGAGSSSSVIREVLGEFAEKAKKQKESRRKTLLAELKGKGISGSAVLPNLNADPEWVRARSELKEKMRQQIREALKSG